MTHTRRAALVLVAFAALGGALSLRAADDKPAPAAGKMRVFEMRTYHAAPGKMEALHARFRDHTTKLLTKHGATIVGYWVDAKQPEATHVWIAAYPSMEAREATWKSFNADPEWVKAKADSEKDGKLVQKADQVFLNPTDYSPMK